MQSKRFIKMQKKSMILTVLITAIVSIMILVIGRRFIWKEPEATLNKEYFTPFAQEETHFSNVVFLGSIPTDLPDTLPLLYTRVSQNADISLKLDNYCETIQAENYDDTIVNYGVDCNYSWYKNENHIQYSSSMMNVNEIKRPNYATSSQIANDFLQMFYNDIELYNDGIGYLYCTDTFCDELEDINQANTIFLPYAFQHQGVSILTHEAIPNGAYVYVDSANRIVKAELDLINIDYTADETQYPLLSIDEAIENINNDNAVLYTYDDYSGELKNSGSISVLHDVQLTDIGLNYLMNEAQDLATPTYYFMGTAKDTYGDTIDVEIITPAIRFTLAD